MSATLVKPVEVLASTAPMIHLVSIRVDAQQRNMCTSVMVTDFQVEQNDRQLVWHGAVALTGSR